MNDIEKTRKLGEDTSSQRTRLVRQGDEETVRLGGPKQDAASPKTRLLRRGPVADQVEQAHDDQDDDEPRMVVGWLVVTGGPGRGKYTAVFDGMNSVGRGEDQSTRIDFGDETISREGHAFITYDYVSRKFYIQHGGKSNLVRVNQAPVLQPTELKQADEISLGSTVLRFVPFCGEGFDWQDK
jgi:hypothetical protein